MERLAVIDFETTGMTPAQGARATEIGVAVLEDGQIVDRYQSLINAGVWIPPFIEELTGISNAMIRRAPSADQVMREVAGFVGEMPLVAHNAAFDSKFWDAELSRIGRRRHQEFACSMLLARRVFPEAPSHKLGSLIAYADLPVTGQFHRALADAEMTAHLVARMCAELTEVYQIKTLTHPMLRQLQRTPKHRVAECIATFISDHW